MELEVSLLERVRRWESLSRWERSELGRDLRRSGLSYGEIMELVPVKKSTLATWCRDVALTEEQIEAIRARTPGQSGVPKDTGRRRREEIARVRAAARSRAEHLLADPMWVAGVVLYWAEGAKSRNRVSLANSDPRTLRLFVAWVRRYLNQDAEFSLHLHLHEGNDERRGAIGGGNGSRPITLHQDVHQAGRDRASQESSPTRCLHDPPQTCLRRLAHDHGMDRPRWRTIRPNAARAVNFSRAASSIGRAAGS